MAKELTKDEFTAVIGPYVGELWPAFTLNAEQAKVWYEKLRFYNVDECKQGIADAYADTVYNAPRLIEVIEKIRALRKLNAGTTGALDLDRQYQEEFKKERGLGGEPFRLVDLLPQELRKPRPGQR